MTQDEIVKLARDQGLPETETEGVFRVNTDDLGRFAHLVATAERNRIWTQAHWTEYERSIVAAEREAIIDIVAMHGGSVEIEAAIRARREK